MVTRSPRILSLKFAKPGSPVSLYAVAQSVSRPTKLNHTVTKAGRSFSCTCEFGSLRRERCAHIKSVEARIRRSK